MRVDFYGCLDAESKQHMGSKAYMVLIFFVHTLESVILVNTSYLVVPLGVTGQIPASRCRSCLWNARRKNCSHGKTHI